jgi:hypothetical protein
MVPVAGDTPRTHCVTSRCNFEAMKDTTSVEEVRAISDEIWNYGGKITHNQLDSLVQKAHTAGASAMLQRVREDMPAVLEKHEDKGDERYGWVKHNNTVLGRIEDDLLSHLTTLQKENEGTITPSEEKV